MLLNCRSYLIRTGFDLQHRVDTYEILDAGTQSLVGLAREMEPKPCRKALRWVWGRNLFPTSVSVWEPDAASPVFLVNEIRSLWCPRLQVSAANGRVLCYFKGKFAILGGGFRVHDGSGALIANLESPTGESNYRLLSRDGRELGTIAEQSMPSGRKPAWTEGYLVAARELHGCRSIGSVLLLAAALALDLVYRERV